jgi:enoyl-CoA hydratase
MDTTGSSATRYDTGTERLEVVLAEAGVARLTFNNPDRRNALSADMRRALPGALGALAEDPSVRVVVVTGAGGRAFVSGADISEFGEARTTVEDRAAYDAEALTIDEAWRRLGKPIIAMISGFCLGAGLFTALAADIRIASTDSRFGVPAARLGLGVRADAVAGLVEAVGPAWAAEILYSARYLTGDEALRAGLVNRVVPAGDLEAVVSGLAAAIAANAPLTVRAAKAALREIRRPVGEQDLAMVDAAVEACFRSQDYQEGQRAFAERRPPRFIGR